MLPLVFLAILGLARADSFWTVLGYHGGDSELSTCNDLVSASFTWDYNSTNALTYSYMFDALCDYPPAMGTILLCTKAYCGNDTGLFERALENAVKSCAEWTIYPVTMEELNAQYLNATKYYQPLDSIANTSVPFYFPTLPDLESGEPELIGYRWFYYNLDSGTWYSVGICGYFLLVILLGTVYNVVRVSGLLSSIGKLGVFKALQHYVIFPSIFPNGRYAQDYGWKWFSILFPNRIQFLVDVGLFALQVGFYCAPYHQNEGAVFSSPTAAWRRAVADRSGVMAFGKIPLLILFAGRNNFLLYITGWSYTTFLHFHKILALWMAVDSLIHSVGYTIMELGYYVEALQEVYFACGVAATVLAFVMCGFAFHSLRKNYYEAFLFTHILLAIGFIAMCWWHCNTLGWMEWLVASVAVWGFDRLVRVIRMSAFGIRTATVTAAGDEMLMLSVPKPSWWSTTSGQYAFVYFAGSYFLQNHPFTIVCRNDCIYAYIKVKNGITRRIWDKLSVSGGKMEQKVCIEGPYGTLGSGGVSKSDHLLLFAGGSGAPAIVDKASHTASGKLYWVVPTLSMVKTYANLLKDVVVPTQIYVTREQGTDSEVSITELLTTLNHQDTSSSEEKSSDVEKSVPISTLVSIHYGRPDVESLLNKDLESTTANTVSVVGCGPPPMMDKLRNAVARSSSTTSKSLNFYDELQVW